MEMVVLAKQFYFSQYAKGRNEGREMCGKGEKMKCQEGEMEEEQYTE